MADDPSASVAGEAAHGLADGGGLPEIPAPPPLLNRFGRTRLGGNRETQRRVLMELASGATASQAAAAAGVTVKACDRLREKDEWFRSAWFFAREAAADLLEAEAFRRAVVGWEEPVFQRGEQVGTVRRYDGKLLELLLKARRPAEFREHPPSVVVNANASVFEPVDALERGTPLVGVARILAAQGVDFDDLLAGGDGTGGARKTLPRAS